LKVIFKFSKFSDGYTIGVGSLEGNILILDLRYLSKSAPTILSGHEGKSISSLNFQNNYKSEKSSSKVLGMRDNRSRSNNFGTTQSESAIQKNEETKSDSKASFKSSVSKENRYDSRLKGEANKEEKIGADITPRQKMMRNPINEIDSDAHLSAYGEPMSMHSSVLSSSSKNEAHTFEPELEEEFKDVDVEMRPQEEDEENIEFQDFSDDQKKYISKLLDEKLKIQKEKLSKYFQNMQIEMIRQFQIQYFELEQVIEDVIESKNRTKFVNSLEDDEDSAN
jgi:hypothetical protein